MIRLKKPLFILASTLMLASCSDKKELASNEPEITKVAVQEIIETAGENQLNYSGSIEADNTVTLGFGVAGRVVKVYVQEGQKVTQGQLLAAVENEIYENSYKVASAGLEQAQDNFNRLEQLYKKGSLPERDYIAVKVGLAQAKAGAAIAAKNLRDTKLYASFTGIVTHKFIEAGANTAPGAPSFTIVKTDKVFATASISENEISNIKIGATTKVTVPSLNLEFTGKVVILNPQADNMSKTFLVKVQIDNASGVLLPGMIADLTITTGKEVHSIIIPTNAIVRDADNINYVFVLKPNNTAFKKRISIAKMTGSSDVIVQEGLQAGDKLIVSGQTTIEDGAPVKL
jgi:membrane fusion protein, multidrug efflux system